MKIYHNNSCSKSNCTLELIEKSGNDFETINYLIEPLTKEELTDLILKLNIPAEALIRKGEAEYKKHFNGKKMTESQWIDAMIKFPILIQRPIVVKGNKAVIGRPIEKVIELLSE